MQFRLLLALAFLGVNCRSATADVISLYRSHDFAVWSVFLDSSAISSPFSLIDFKVTARQGEFQNINSGLNSGVPWPAGELFTYRNRLLDIDKYDLPNSPPGKGWVVLHSTSASEIYLGGGLSNGIIDTSGEVGGKLFLTNIHRSAGATFDIEVQLLSSSGTTISTQHHNFLDLAEWTYPELSELPEPGSHLLMLAGVIGLAAMRRRTVVVASPLVQLVSRAR